MQLPTRDTFSTTLPELRSKRAEIQVEISQIKSECAITRARMQESPSPGNEQENRLRKLLGKPTVAATLPDHDSLQELLRKLSDLNSVVSLLDSEILKEERVANNKLIDSVKPEIKRLGGKFAQAFVHLHAAHIEFDQYIDSLEDVGASVGAFRIKPNGLSHPKDKSGAYFFGLCEFIDAGLISKSDMPKVLK